MKKRRRKIFIVCSTLILIILLNVNAFALPPSVSIENHFTQSFVTPFTGFCSASIEGPEEESFSDDYIVRASLPNIYFDTTDLSTYNDQVYSRYKLPDKTYSFYTECENISSYYNLDASTRAAVISYDYKLHFTPFNGERFFNNFIAFTLNNAYVFPSANCYDIDNLNSVGGCTFFVLDPDTQEIDFDFGVQADFQISGLDEKFDSYYEGSAVSYYDILVNSDIPWEDYANEYDQDYTASEFVTLIDYFREKYDSMLYINDSEDANTIVDMFDWVGPLFGAFEVGIVVDPELRSQSFNYTVRSVVVDDSLFEDFFSYSVESSVYRGKTGFERTTKFLGSAVSGFLNLEIMPNFSMAGLLIVIISFSVVLWWLKVFAGG